MTSPLSVLDTYRSGYSLPRGVYHDPEIYEQEVRAIFMKSWLYVGHQSQIPRRGDYFLFEIAGESVILVRADDGQINALLNVCRHRGSRICDAASGHEARLTCRYHGWTYGLDGSLRAASRMPESFDKSRHGLHRVQVKVLAGLIFINFECRWRAVRFTAAGPDGRACTLRPGAGKDRAQAELRHVEQLEARGGKLQRVLPLRAPRILNIPWRMAVRFPWPSGAGPSSR